MYEGIWMVRKIKFGTHYKLLTKKVDDLREAAVLSSLEPYRISMIKAIEAYLKNCRIEKDAKVYKNVNINKIVDLVFEELK